MKRQLLFSSLIIVTLFIITGCGKDDPAPAKTKTELITQGSWKFDNATASGIGDISGAINACLKDNIAVFTSTGSLTIDESANVCSPTYAGNYTWEFQSNETILHLNAPIFTGGSTDFTIVSITETNLVLSQVMTVAPYPPTTVEVTFKH
ncbi:MAG TPA: lipocalin family protein [Chitinophagaceae bacterium]|nr:lipocalin family protein [Chitinophagaceae bacterium]